METVAWPVRVRGCLEDRVGMPCVHVGKPIASQRSDLPQCRDGFEKRPETSTDQRRRGRVGRNDRRRHDVPTDFSRLHGGHRQRFERVAARGSNFSKNETTRAQSDVGDV